METNGFAPTLLLAMPQLTDPNFTRSVVLLCQHGSEGALGFVVNRPTELRAAEAVALDPPVMRDSVLLLGDDPGVDDSEQIVEGIHLTASVEVLRKLLESDPSAVASRRCRLLLGYAGWGPGQLDSELAASAWLNVAPNAGLVFETPPEEMWERAIRSLGVDPMALQAGPGIQ
jgi:putative transcriptional regulator